jgi:hypothetical protein
MPTLLENQKTIRVSNAVAVGTTSVNSSVVDTLGYDGVLFTIHWGTITDGTPLIKAQQDTALAFNVDPQDLLATSVVAAVTDDNKLSQLDIHKSRDRFVRCVVTRGGATGAVIDSITAQLYGPATQSGTLDSTVAAAEAWISPAEGTA